RPVISLPERPPVLRPERDPTPPGWATNRQPDAGAWCRLAMTQGVGQGVDEGGQHRRDVRRVVEAGEGQRIADLLLMHPALGILSCDVQPDRGVVRSGP